MKTLLLAVLCLSPFVLSAQTMWLDQLPMNAVDAGWGTTHANRSIDGNALTIAGTRFDRGVGTHAVSTWLLHLDGAGKRFTASVGVDDEVGKGRASIEFHVLGDRRLLWSSGVMKKGDAAKHVDVPLDGVALLGLLVTDGGDGIDYDHADWADARIELASQRTAEQLSPSTVTPPALLTPAELPSPRINGPRVFGVRPGRPLLYTIPATGLRPMTFSAEGLPPGARVDASTGRITGSVARRGSYAVTLFAENKRGTVRAPLRIVVGDTIALTPPLGWNSWNCWADAVDDAKVRAAADAFVSTGLANHGWSYINIDDCWMVKPGSSDSLTRGDARDANGMIRSNAKFPDMRALGDYVHDRGLKLGIYSSPGTLTCAGYAASYQYESNDARQYAQWGIDYLKYDWCSYERIARDHSLPELKKPYHVMRAALDSVNRDIVYSLCQYGMGDVWTWGGEVGGNCWRTTGDITDSWASMAEIGFNQAGHERFAGPGRWNDPDMLVVGKVGWGPQLHPTRLTPDEQYTHISLWSLLAAPLLIGCDLLQLDDFTRSLLTNDEVLAVNQDELGAAASRLSDRDGVQIWMRHLSDGTMAVGVFNTGRMARRAPADYFAWSGETAAAVSLTAAELGFGGPIRARDLWRQKDIAEQTDHLTLSVPRHGVVLLKIAPAGKE